MVEKDDKALPQDQAEQNDPKLEISASRLFTSWMVEQQASFIFTTYQAGKVFLIGLNPDGQLSIFERTFNRCMGLCGNEQTFYMSSLYQIWRFENLLDPGTAYQNYDRLFVPQVAHTVGDIDVHDMVITKDNKLVFVNTLFSCLAELSETHSFKPIWQPKFISKLAAEDRCHLNGLACVDGQPKYVTVVGKSDVNEGWRDHRKNGGLVIDIDTDEVVASGLSMPHSPRYYQGQLWLLDSGTGYLGTVDLKTGHFERVCFCPGYARGLAFHGDYAVVGLSQNRHEKTFTGLEFSETLSKSGVEPRCGLQIINLKTGDASHSLTIEGVVSELYDVIVLPKVIRPMALGLKTDEIRHIISVE